MTSDYPDPAPERLPMTPGRIDEIRAQVDRGDVAFVPPAAVEALLAEVERLRRQQVHARRARRVAVDNIKAIARDAQAEVDRQAKEIAAFRRACAVKNGLYCEDVCLRSCIGVCTEAWEESDDD